MCYVSRNISGLRGIAEEPDSGVQIFTTRLDKLSRRLARCGSCGGAIKISAVPRPSIGDRDNIEGHALLPSRARGTSERFDTVWEPGGYYNDGDPIKKGPTSTTRTTRSSAASILVNETLCGDIFRWKAPIANRSTRMQDADPFGEIVGVVGDV